MKTYEVKEGEDQIIVVNNGEVVAAAPLESDGPRKVEMATGHETKKGPATKAVRAWERERVSVDEEIKEDLAEIDEPADEAPEEPEAMELPTEEPEVKDPPIDNIADNEEDEAPISGMAEMMELIKKQTEKEIKSAERKALKDARKDVDASQRALAVAEEALKLPKDIKTERDAENHLQDPTLGDKTPAFVNWYAENKSPEEFLAKYGGRRVACLESIGWNEGFDPIEQFDEE